MEKFSDRNHKILTGIKSFFKGLYNWIKTNKKLATTIFAALILCVVAIIVIRFFLAKETDETNMVAEAAEEVLGDEENRVNEIVDVPLEQDQNPE